MGTRKHYDEQFKRTAVQRMFAGEPAVLIARELKIRRSILYRWRAEYGGESTPAAAKDAITVRKGPKGRSVYPLALKQQAIALVKNGMTRVAAAGQLNVPSSRVDKWVASGVKRGAKGEARTGNQPVQVAVAASARAARPPTISALSRTDSILYLRHAEQELIRLIREGLNTISADRALVILALRAAELE